MMPSLLSRARRGAVLLAFTAAPYVACAPEPEPPRGYRPSSPQNPWAPGEAALPTPPDLWVASPCGKCVVALCQSECVSCNEDQECSAYLDCLSRCPANGNALDTVCEAECVQATSSIGATLVDFARECRAQNEALNCLACPSSPSGETPPPPVEPAIMRQQCAPASDGSECAQCKASSCCETRAACAGDAACVHYEGCINECVLRDDGNAYACLDECEQEAPGGRTLYALDVACVQARCSSPGPCRSAEPDAFDSCVRERCALPQARCFAHEGCFTLRFCLAGCGSDQSCQQSCLDQHMFGLARQLLREELECVNEHC